MTARSTALLIIDTQVAFFHAPKPLYQADRLIENIKNLTFKARQAHIPIIYVQHNASGDLAWMNDTPSKDIHPDIAPQESDLVFQKWQLDIFAEPAFQHELEARDIRRLVITGCQTEHCIQNSCRSGAALGYDVVLVGDAHATFDTDTSTAQQIVEQVTNDLGAMVTIRMAQDVVF